MFTLIFDDVRDMSILAINADGAVTVCKNTCKIANGKVALTIEPDVEIEEKPKRIVGKVASDEVIHFLKDCDLDEVAKDAGIDISTVQRAARGERIRRSNLDKIERALGKE